MRSMNIWVINQYAGAPDQPGFTRHFSLARELIRRGHRVSIVATSFHHSLRKDTRLQPGESWRYEVIEGVPFLWLRTPAYRGNSAARVWNMAAFGLSAIRRSRPEILGDPDVVLGSIPHPFTGLAAERLSRRYRVPFVLEVRDLWPDSLIDLGDVSPLHPFILWMRWAERYLYRRATRILSILPLAYEHMVRQGATREKIFWLPNGIDLTGVPPFLPLSERETFTVMYAGSHGLANDLDRVLDAAHLLQKGGNGKAIRFVLVGDGPEKERLMQRAREMGLHNVEFRDPVPKREVFRVLAEADAFLLLLKEAPVFRFGASPNKLYDYMAMGRPVIFAVNSPYNPVQESHSGITVSDASPEALAQAVHALASLPREEREAMGRRGRAYVEEHHSFPRLAEQLEEILRGALFSPQ
ncbi:MAG: glycosyltransferase family 4 protein [Brockia lithotrophica]|nr:glycosyltransferase family 4 protein [Brockia lithotrophica]